MLSGSGNVYVHALHETIPFKRFQQLIDEKKYVDAASFAEKFGLDTQVGLHMVVANRVNNVSLVAVYY
jgi:hypothetical protein